MIEAAAHAVHSLVYAAIPEWTVEQIGSGQGDTEFSMSYRP